MSTWTSYAGTSQLRPKPNECKGCPLHGTGRGFAPATGPLDALICFVGEALGRQEADRSTPFVGQAGAMLNRALGLINMDRDQQRIGNIVSCQPPNDWLAGSPWEFSAINHCSVHRIQLSGHKVYIPMGVTATRTLVTHRGVQYGGRIEDWQSYVIGGDKPPWFIPTFHPAYLMRGNQKLMGAFLHAIQRAIEVAAYGHTPDTADLIVDPDPIWFDSWVSTTLEAHDCWIAVDIETPTKSTDEGEQSAWAGNITRINFATHPDQGITVPWDPRYMNSIRRILASHYAKIFWNENFDVPILSREGMEIGGPIMDGMWAWHMLQSDLPRGLGFVSPFYSKLPPWKHLAATDIGPYSAMDGVQTLRCMTGIAKDLKKQDQWDTFVNHFVHFDSRVLHPAEQVGLRLDPARLTSFHSELADRQGQLYDDIQKMVPDKLKPISGGWKRPPGNKHPGAFPMTVTETTKVCTVCNEVDVTMKHKCRKGTNGT